MLRSLLDAIRSGYASLQIWALVIFLVCDAAGYGLGFWSYLFGRSLTATGKFHVADLVLGAPPPGPIRLTSSERAAVSARIARTFGGAPPKTTALAEMLWLYRPRNVLCVWKPGNIAMAPADCNALASAHPFFMALLRRMHPKTELLFYETATGYHGDALAAAFFLGRDNKPKILLDLSQVRSSAWRKELGFKAKIYGGQGVGDLTLIDIGDGFHLIDDPGAIQRRNAACAAAHCVARLILYGYDHEGYRNAATNEFSTRNLADIPLSVDLEQRFALYAALTGKAAPIPTVAIDMSYKSSKTAVTKWTTAHLERKLDAILGTGATARALFSPVGYHVPWATVIAMQLDGTTYLLWDNGAPFPSLGTDKLAFHWSAGKERIAVTPVGSAGGVWVLPLPPSHLKKPALIVHKSVEPAGQPRSTFAAFHEVLAPLLTP